MYIIKVSFNFKIITLEKFDVDQHVRSWNKKTPTHHSYFNWYSCNLIAF